MATYWSSDSSGDEDEDGATPSSAPQLSGVLASQFTTGAASGVGIENDAIAAAAAASAAVAALRQQEEGDSMGAMGGAEREIELRPLVRQKQEQQEWGEVSEGGPRESLTKVLYTTEN